MSDGSHASLVALAAVLDDAANLLRVPVKEVSVTSLEAREWRDSCLGLGKPDEACLDVITPGYLVVIGDGLVYRTNTTGDVRRDTSTIDRELVVHFRQTGGIGGWTSEYYADDATLSSDEAAHIRQFFDDAAFFDLPEEVGNGEPIRDGYSYTVFLAHGRRNHAVRTYDGSGPHESPELQQFVGWLKQRAPEPHPRPTLNALQD